MPSIPDILWGLVLPGAIAVLVLLLAWRPWQRGAGKKPDGRWAGAIVMGAAFIIGYARFVRVPRWPPIESDGWLVFLAILLVGFGLLDSLLHPPLWARVPVAMATVAMAMWLVTKPLIGNSIPFEQARWWITGLACASTLVWISLDWLSDHAPGITVPTVMGLVVGGTAAAVALADASGQRGLVVGSLGMVSGSAFLVALWARRLSLARGGALAFTILAHGLLVYGYFYNPVDTVPPRVKGMSALLLGAPLLAFVGDAPGIKRMRNWQRYLIRTLAVAVPVVIAVIIAKLESDAAVDQGF